MNPADIPIVTDAAGQPAAVVFSPERDSRIRTVLAELDAAETRRDEAMVSMVNGCVDCAVDAEQLRDRAFVKFAGKYEKEASSGEKKRDKALKAVLNALLDNALSAENKRDEIIRAAGATPPMIPTVIYDHIQAGTYDDFIDDNWTVPMAQAAVASGFAPVAVVDDPVVMPRIDEPPPPMIPPPVPPPPVGPPATDAPPLPPGLIWMTWPCQNVMIGTTVYPAYYSSAYQLWYSPNFGWLQPGTFTPFGPCVVPPVVPPPPEPPPPPLPPGGVIVNDPVPPVAPPPAVDPCDLPTTEECRPVVVNLPYKWWYFFKCVSACSFEVCTVKSAYTPADRPGWILRGPYNSPLTASAIQQLGTEVCNLGGTVPPVVLPPVPPPEPPPPPKPPEPPPPPPEPPGPGDPPVTAPPTGDDDPSKVCKKQEEYVKTVTAGEEPIKWPDWWKAAAAQASEESGWNPLWSQIGKVIGAAFSVTAPVYAMMGLPSPNAAAVLGGAIGAGEWVRRITGMPFDYLTEAHQQTLRFTNPLYISPQAQVDKMYLVDEINKDVWKCLTKMNGFRTNVQHASVRADRTRASVADVITLWRRKQLSDGRYKEEMRKRGVLDEGDQVMLERATEGIPSPSEITRYAKRDIANPQFQELGDLTKGYTEAYDQQMKDWWKANGLSEAHRKSDYMASWDLPSPEQMAQMVRRLRPGRTDDITVPGPNGQLVPLDVKPVTVETMRKVLQYADYAPAFWDRFIAVSYLPINQTQIRMAYTAGSMDIAEVKERYQDAGYSPKDSAALAEFTRIDRTRKLMNTSGGWTMRRIFAALVDGTVNELDARQLWYRTITDVDVVNGLVEDAGFERERKKRATCVKGVKRKYVTAEWDDAQVRNALSSVGIEQQAVESILSGWKCEAATRTREPTVAMLQKWYYRGLLSPTDMYIRLSRLGYNNDDATRIIQTASMENQEKYVSVADKALMKARREADRQCRVNEARRTGKPCPPGRVRPVPPV